MRRIFSLVLACAGLACAADNLIVCDEIPAMQSLAKQVETRLHQTSEITNQDKLPVSLSVYRNVTVYIHGDLHEPAENAFIAYAKGGGNLVLLHHTISSGKRKNKAWLPFLGVTLPTSYKYIDDMTWEIAPTAAAGGGAITMHETEIYLNHVNDSDRTVLYGLRFTDPKTAEHFEQPIAAWTRKAERGTVWYFMPGHKASDFEYEPYVAVLMKAYALK